MNPVVLCRGLIGGFLIFCTAYAGTLDDIRTRTAWQSACHSERDSVYIPDVTPARLIANLSRYHKDRIKMQVLFYGVTTQTLNTVVGPKKNIRKWSSARYISFSVKDPREQVSPKDMRLFIHKNNPDSEKVFNLTKDTPILLTGTVRDTAKGKAWIEVEKIELL